MIIILAIDDDILIIRLPLVPSTALSVLGSALLVTFDLTPVHINLLIPPD
jgi:hypothetical protein